MAVGVVSYNGYTAAARKTAAQNAMQQIALMQTEYYSGSGGYYFGCGYEKINEDLFDADVDEVIIDVEHYSFCIKEEASGGGYIITGIGDGKTWTLDAKGQNNFHTRGF
jgi:type II secretory pathway pseudopilin PulG